MNKAGIRNTTLSVRAPLDMKPSDFNETLAQAAHAFLLFPTRGRELYVFLHLYARWEVADGFATLISV